MHIPPTNGFCGGRSIKACIDDELYDMESVLVRCPPRDEPEKKERGPGSLRRLLRALPRPESSIVDAVE